MRAFNPSIPKLAHGLTKEGSVTEVSTPDSVEDNYRIGPGDSQVLDENTNATD